MYQREANYLGPPCSANSKGGSDCGVFAVAFATSLCTGDSPVTITYHQPSLRGHLMKCLERQTITAFSGVKKKATSLRYSKHFQVYCCCRQPESDERMVECQGCHEWYHDTCVPIPEIIFTNQTVEWFCPSCRLMKWHILINSLSVYKLSICYICFHIVLIHDIWSLSI